MSQKGLVSVMEGSKRYSVLFPSPNGYIKNFEFLETSDGTGFLPSRESITAIIGRQWSGKEIVLSLTEAKAIDWGGLLPKAYRRHGIYVVTNDNVVVGAYFLGHYSDDSNTNMDAVQQGFLLAKDQPTIVGDSHRSGVFRPDFVVS